MLKTLFSFLAITSSAFAQDYRIPETVWNPRYLPTYSIPETNWNPRYIQTYPQPRWQYQIPTFSSYPSPWFQYGVPGIPRIPYGYTLEERYCNGVYQQFIYPNR